MRAARELLTMPINSPEWDEVLGLPICDQLEPRFLRVLHKPTLTDGTILDPSDGYTLARWYRGSVVGLNAWGGPSLIDGAKFLVKHPDVNLAVGNRKGLGETNGLLEVDGLMFALITDRERVFAGRPIMPIFQTTLLQKFRDSLSGVKEGVVSRYQGIGIA